MPRVYLRIAPEMRFWAKVDKGPSLDGCWLWTGAKNGGGYGNFMLSKDQGLTKTIPAHVYSYILANGPIPSLPGVRLVLDHLCRNRGCVNPAHLEIVTNRENILRGESLSAKRARQTHCARGHELTPENTHIRPNGRRRCKVCMQSLLKRYVEMKRKKACRP